MINKYVFIENMKGSFGIVWLVILDSYGISNKLFMDIYGSLITISRPIKYNDL